MREVRKKGVKGMEEEREYRFVVSACDVGKGVPAYLLIQKKVVRE
jgi:hypothetical protein